MKKNLTSCIKALVLACVMTSMVSCDKEVNKIEVDNQFAIQLFADTVRMRDLLTMVNTTTSEYFRIEENGKIILCLSDTISDIVVSEDVLSGNTKFDFVGTEEIYVGFPNLSGNLDVIKPELKLSYINTFDFEAMGVIDSAFLTNVTSDKISLIKDWNTIERPLPPTGNTSAELTGVENYIVDEISLLEDYRAISFNGNININSDDVDYDAIEDNSHIDIIAQINLPLDFVIDSLVFDNTYDFDLNFDDNNNSQNINISGGFDEIQFRFTFVNTLPIQVKPQLYLVQNDVVIDSMFVDDFYVHAGSIDNPTENVAIISFVNEKLQNIQQADHVLLNVGLTSLGNNVSINADDYFFLRVGMTTKTSEINID